MKTDAIVPTPSSRDLAQRFCLEGETKHKTDNLFPKEMASSAAEHREVQAKGNSQEQRML